MASLLFAREVIAPQGKGPLGSSGSGGASAISKTLSASAFVFFLLVLFCSKKNEHAILSEQTDC
jgi:hypothetical protein